MSEHNSIKIEGMSEAQREAIALDYLSALKPGFQSIETFKHLARLGGLDTVEILPVRPSTETESGLEVLLARRAPDEPFWPNLLHVAGSIIREDDPITHEHDYQPAIARAMLEMGTDLEFVRDPIEIETVHRRSERSREVTIRFWGEVAGDPLPEKGEFYDAAGVLRHAPELGILDSHVAFIERVAAAYHLSAAENTKTNFSTS